MSNNDLLKNWVKRIENVYDFIAKKINALVVLLNEASGKETDPETKALAENILRALRDFEKSELA